MSMKKYAVNFSNAGKEYLAYKSNYVIRALFLVFILFVTYSLWKVIYTENSYSQKEFSQLIWYLFLTRAISMCLTDIQIEMIAEIRLGQIAVLMNRPYNFVFFKLSGSLGKSFIPSLITLVLTCIFGGVMIGFSFVDITLTGTVFSLMLILNGVIIDWLIKFLISTLSFWLHEIKGVLLIYQRLIMFLGGVMIPFEIFPDWLKKVSAYLPLNFITNLPARVFVNFNYIDFGQVFMKQTIYIIILVLVVLRVYRMGVKHIYVNGG